MGCTVTLYHGFVTADFGVLFFLFMFLFFSVTLSSILVVSELWAFYLFQAVINSHAAVISVPGKEALPDLIEVYCRTERV